jgi:hypothetical protein
MLIVLSDQVRITETEPQFRLEAPPSFQKPPAEIQHALSALNRTSEVGQVAIETDEKG